MQHRRRGTLAAAGVALLVTLAACGADSDGATLPVADERSAATDPSDAPGDFSEGDSTQEASPVTDLDAPPSEEPEGSTDAPSAEPIDDATGNATDNATESEGEGEGEGKSEGEGEAEGEGEGETAGADEGETAVEEAPAESATTEAPDAAAPAEPVAGGRLFAPDVQPDARFDTNPFPDLVVDDIGKDAQVNIKNILPSDRPVLLWAWAPH